MMNCHDPAYSAMFNALMEEVFGFSFAPWQALGLWDERYESYSVIRDGRMLSNICVFKSELLIVGRPVAAYQLGAVATAKAYRGQGLSRALMDHVLAVYPDVPLYLFANQSVLGFYPRFGFERKAQWELWLEAGDAGWTGEAGRIYPPKGIVRGAERGGIAPGDAQNNGVAPGAPALPIPFTNPRVKDALARRGAHSALLDTLNADSVTLFHLLMESDLDVYDLPGLDALTVVRREGDTLFLADVIAAAPIGYADVIAALPFEGIRGRLRMHKGAYQASQIKIQAS